MRKLYLIVLMATAVQLPSCKSEKELTPSVNLDMGGCDASLQLTESDPVKAAQALDICKSAGDWGLVTARFERVNGDSIGVNRQIGIMNMFGLSMSPRSGQSMLVLSSGAARTPSQPQACGSSSCTGTGVGTPVQGVPADVPGCPVSSNIYDDICFSIKLKVPAEAKGFSVDYRFFSFDYPNLVCSAYNDQFQIQVSPAPSGAIKGNVSFDANSKPIGANCAFMSALDSANVTGTGFGLWGEAGETSWLRTTVPVTGGSEITVKFMIYDVGDQASDATVLLDNFIWLKEAVTVETKPIP